MSKVIVNYCLLLFCLVNWFEAPRLVAQNISIYVEDVQANVGGTASVNVRVTNFSDVSGVQFSLNWNPEHLAYTGLSNMALGASADGNFNRSAIDQGKLGYLHADMSLQGFNLGNQEILFTVNFNVLLPDNSLADITFTDSPTSRTVANANGVMLETDFFSGSVTVGEPTSVGEQVINDARFTAYPNPFETTTLLTFTARKAGTADLSVYDAVGKQVFNKNFVVTAGENTLPLSANEFPAVGVYLLNVTTEYGSFGRKLVFSGRR